MAGGPMYYIEKGTKGKFFARLFAFLGAVAATVGAGTCIQAHAIAGAAHSFGIPIAFTAISLGVIVAIITIKGIRRIAYVAERVVPLMTVSYMGAAIMVLIFNHELIPGVLQSIFVGAFSPEAVLGGGGGVTLMMVIQTGMCRGTFAHEAGQGISSIASASAKTNSPSEQGLVSMIGAFLSITVCTMTALVLLVTAEKTKILSTDFAVDGVSLAANAFGYGLGAQALGRYVVDLSILFFAFTTIIGYNYYGEKCVEYLLGSKAILGYKILFLVFIVLGPFWKIKLIFSVADIATGLMVIANLVGLIALRKVVTCEEPH
jgi:AGCS family alanine or glycine:cation symporter